jgi:hypothetical protein
VPTAADIAAFNGLHCAATYRRAVRDEWRCPCCARSPQQLIRWSDIRGQSQRAMHGDQYGMGWTISFAHHHCHGADWGSPARFPTTLICGDCNSADGATKRKLQLPTAWSFSPVELARFVRCSPHTGRTLINYHTAAAIYRQSAAALSGPTAPLPAGVAEVLHQ